MAAPLWPLRDDRTLSSYAKLAYYSLWTRGTDIRPSMATLADDMACSVRKAQMAVRELESRGLVKVLPRVTADGDPDSNGYELYPVQDMHHPSAQSAPGVPHDVHPKNGTPSTQLKGDISLASRRARPAVTREQIIDLVRQAVARSYSQQEADDITDGQAVALWYQLVSNRTPTNPVKYLGKIFDETPHLESHLANAGTEEDWTCREC